MILIANKKLEVIKVIENYKSLIWTRRFFECDDFELKFSWNEELKGKIQLGYFINKNHLSGIIESINITIDENGEEIATIKGRSFEILLSRRIYVGSKMKNEPVSLLSNNIVTETCVNVSPSRVIPFLTIQNPVDHSDVINFNRSYFNVYDELISINKPFNKSFKIELDLENKRLIFKTLKPNDLTYQYGNPNLNSVIFSRKFENLISSDYTNANDSYKNISLVAGEGDGTNRTTTWSGTETTGFDRFELFIDARDLQKGEQSDDNYINQLKQRGCEKLSEYYLVDSYECDVITNGYMEKWDVGDTVTIFEFNKQLDATITEVVETYEDVYTVNVVFGEITPNLVKKIKRMR